MGTSSLWLQEICKYCWLVDTMGCSYKKLQNIISDKILLALQTITNCVLLPFRIMRRYLSCLWRCQVIQQEYLTFANRSLYSITIPYRNLSKTPADGRCSSLSKCQRQCQCQHRSLSSCRQWRWGRGRGRGRRYEQGWGGRREGDGDEDGEKDGKGDREGTLRWIGTGTKTRIGMGKRRTRTRKRREGNGKGDGDCFSVSISTSGIPLLVVLSSSCQY